MTTDADNQSEFVFTRATGRAAGDALVELIEALPLHGFTELVGRANTVLRFVLAATAAAPEAVDPAALDVERQVDALWSTLASPAFASDVNGQRAAIRAALEVARSRA